MAIDSGTKLGRYEVRSKIGEGGMGEVYRARDEKLNRDVAIKVLPADLSENAERLNRFEQEAQAAGALNHPNILAVYDVGVHDGSPYVVSELLEGETLRDLLEQRQPATRKSIDYAIQLAHGLAAAHDKGIVHRDIKPDNIFITKDERVKILDFGLAKLAQPSGEDVAQTEIATRKVRTDPGTVMGTVGYMSPEQVRGQAVDHRTDIFSFGAVLYEMLSRRRAFRGDSAIETLNAILKEEPAELTASNPGIAPGLERVVWHCLEKSPERRFQSATDIAFALESLTGVMSHSSQQTGAALRPVLSGRFMTPERMIWLGACVLLVIVAAALAFAYFSRSPAAGRTVRLSLTTPDKTTLPAELAVSPDSSRVAFTAMNADGKRLLWTRELDSLTAQPLSGTEGASSPFWSPDNRFVGYFANSKLYKVDATGGRPQALCDVKEDRGGTWNSDGVILFSGSEGLYRVSAQGGTAVLATKVDPKEEAHRWPYFMPDGRHFVFLGDAQTTEGHHIRMGTLDSQDTQILFTAISRVVYAPPGYLLYVTQGALVAQAFDAGKMKINGEPITTAEHVKEVGPNHEFDFSVSNNGVLAYQAGTETSQIVWFDRSGKKIGTAGDTDSYGSIALSPDGQRAAVGLLDADGRQSDIWLLDLSRGSKSRLTFDPHSEGDPVWSPDGTHLVFSSNKTNDGHTHLYLASANGTGDDQLLLTSDFDDFASSWSNDGQTLLFSRYGRTPSGIWALSMSGEHQAKSLMQSGTFDLAFARFSPNGRLIAYTSTESGKPEIYVQTFPPAGKWQVSNGGGAFPLWRSDGKELFYVTIEGKVISAKIGSENPFQSDVPQQLFQTPIKPGLGWPYAVTPDGGRFLINAPAEPNNPAPMTLVINWVASMKQK
jgi:serine/threonine protein kinase